MERKKHIIKNIFHLRRETGMGLFDLLFRAKWIVDIHGYSGEISTWDFAELMYKHNLTYRQDKRE